HQLVLDDGDAQAARSQRASAVLPRGAAAQDDDVVVAAAHRDLPPLLMTSRSAHVPPRGFRQADETTTCLTSAMYRPAAAQASSGVRPLWRAFIYAAYQSHQSCGGATASNEP